MCKIRKWFLKKVECRREEVGHKRKITIYTRCVFIGSAKNKSKNTLSVSHLCKLAKVPRCAYYKYLKNIDIVKL